MSSPRITTSCTKYTEKGITDNGGKLQCLRVFLQEPQAVPESELPLTLPETDNFKPSGSPESPLANISDWVTFTDPQTGALLK